jgi:thioredoxin-related protein
VVSLNRNQVVNLSGISSHACVNCRKMEANVWTDKDVYQRINEDYVLIQLYVDDKTDLAAGEQITTIQGKHIKTIGNKWSDLEAAKFQANSQPFYVLLDNGGNLLVPPRRCRLRPGKLPEIFRRRIKSLWK